MTSENKAIKREEGPDLNELIADVNARLRHIFPKGALNKVSRTEHRELSDADWKYKKKLNKKFRRELGIVLGKKVLQHASLNPLGFTERRLKLTLVGFSEKTDEDRRIRRFAAIQGVEDVVRKGLSKKYLAACCDEFSLVAFSILRGKGIVDIGRFCIWNLATKASCHDLLFINVTPEDVELLKKKKFQELSEEAIFYDPWNDGKCGSARRIGAYLVQLSKTQMIFDQTLSPKKYDIVEVEYYPGKYHSDLKKNDKEHQLSQEALLAERKDVLPVVEAKATTTAAKKAIASPAAASPSPLPSPSTSIDPGLVVVALLNKLTGLVPEIVSGAKRDWTYSKDRGTALRRLDKENSISVEDIKSKLEKLGLNVEIKLGKNDTEGPLLIVRNITEAFVARHSVLGITRSNGGAIAPGSAAAVGATITGIATTVADSIDAAHAKQSSPFPAGSR